MMDCRVKSGNDGPAEESDRANKQQGRGRMPEVTISMAAGRTDEQKKAIMLDITNSIVKHAKVDPEAVVIQINEAPHNNKMKGGKTFIERNAKK
jgi:4-oxalocrotonate tautomerase